MRDDMIERVKECADFVVQSGATVRQAARRFGVSKSTTHKDLVERLKMVDGVLYEKAMRVLMKNKAERHLRGGEATRRKYAEKEA